MVKEVDMEVPSLFGRILPHSGQQGSDKDGIKVIADPVHGLPTGVNRIKPTYCREQLNLPLRPIDDDPNWNEDIKVGFKPIYYSNPWSLARPFKFVKPLADQNRII